jgi:DNA modification methylase/superfamily II DNA or RNA helicase
MNSYNDFLLSKKVYHKSTGIDISVGKINPILFPFQRDIVKWALHKGRCAVFADTGLGKTFIQVEWARLLGVRTLIVAPLSVARQTVREAQKLGVNIYYTRSGDDLKDGINITNYEMVDKFDPMNFDAVVLDESSILKALSGKTRRLLTELFSDTKYRLCCTATPAPNDYTELGNHAEFLGICSEAEMRAMFFINANKEHTFEIEGKVYRKKGSNNGGQEWRLKRPAEQPFFHWLSSWAMSITKPSDLDYDDDGFILPELRIIPEFIRTQYTSDKELFFTGLHGIEDRINIRREILDTRIVRLNNIIPTIDGQCIVWCGLDAESKAVSDLLDGTAIHVTGSDTPEYKAESFERFQDGEYKFLVTKPKIGGFGMNFQNANTMIFFGINDSWETWYQCIRREWRYGQTRPVSVYVLLSEQENEIYLNVMRKDAMARRLRQELIASTRDFEKKEIERMDAVSIEDERTTIRKGEKWVAMNGDSCIRLGELDDNSIDLSVYSPPFADLYTYTDSDRDLGNSRNWAEFFDHYSFIIREILRVTKPGRLTCVHTSDIPAMAQKDGYIGVKDFPGEVIRAYEKNGWQFVGRAFVQKNPQAQAIRTKSKALLFVQLRKDSSDSRPALVDQVLIFKKPGDNAVPVSPVANGEMDNETWIEWANGIWLGIQESDTLQYSTARGADDEKHICPLQLGTIERCIKLYSNPGDTVLSPFMGIGSEGFVALKYGRRFIGCELKPSYFDIAVRNLQRAEHQYGGLDLFSIAGIDI